MCYKITCSKCSKYWWGGCGNHKKSVIDSIEINMRCICQDRRM